MRIEGNLATYEFSDLLQWLAQGNKSGVLTVSDGGVEYQLGFDHGRIDMSSSSDPEQRLDSYLFAKGVIDEATLARAERLREATQMMSGQVLVTLGAVTELQLAGALRDKTEAILSELLTWEQGMFAFDGGDRPESTMVPISLEVTKLLLECMHRLDQRQLGEEPQPAAVLTVNQPGMPADATQAIEGLALAEVLNPESLGEPGANSAIGGLEDVPTGELPPHYAVMAQPPGSLRRMVPYALVMLLSLSTGAFYLANIEASAQAVDVTPTGEPILFTQTAGPLPVRTQGVGDAQTSAPVPAAELSPEVDDVDSQETLRRRYEQELAVLRKELEEARRLSPPTAREPLPTVARDEGAMADVPADSMMRAVVARPAVAKPPAGLPAPGPSARPTSSEVIPRAEPLVDETPEPALTAATTTVPSGEAAFADTVASFDFVNPSLLARPAPSYPAAARRFKRGATVTVRVLVGVDGRVEDVERIGLKAGMGFDRAAEEAAMASIWKPGTRGGDPTAMWADLRFEFSP